MAYTKLYQVDRADYAATTSTPLSRGMVLNGQQTEQIIHTKLNSDTTFDVTLVSIVRPSAVFVEAIVDTNGTLIDLPAAGQPLVSVPFVQKSARVITVSSAGNYTRGRFLILGRADV